MKDTFNRDINYLRISVTDRCNLRCKYCMPEYGIESIYHDDVLRFEEIIKIVKSAALIGIKKVRITGGEPLVRKGIAEMIQKIDEIPQIDDIALTTNGVLFPQMSKDLKKAGLKRVNISLDTLNPDKYAQITRRGNLEDVLKAIESALELGFNPVKVNFVAVKGFNDSEILDFVNLTKKAPLHVRFIELMPMGSNSEIQAKGYISSTELMDEICANEILIPEKVDGSGPAKYFRIPDAPGTIGFISPISEHFCSSCNRIRLTADGHLKPCLHSSKEIDLKTPLRDGASTDEISDLILSAIKQKPQFHNINQTNYKPVKKAMSQIGG